jgi:Rieske Fe-S protein
MTDVQTTTAAETHEAEPVQACSCAHSTRRNVLLGAGAVGATAVLAACGTGTTNTNGTGFTNDPAPAGSKGADANAGYAGTGDKNTNNSGGGSGGSVITKTTAVAVGSGIITADYVVTQPAAGTFKAFSKICPHAGCPVNKVTGSTISCPCHGSQFSITDGSVKAGPAQTGLTPKEIKVQGTNIVAA